MAISIVQVLSAQGFLGAAAPLFAQRRMLEPPEKLLRGAVALWKTTKKPWKEMGKTMEKVEKAMCILYIYIYYIW